MKALAPWAGWIGGALGWILSDQFGSDLAQAHCARADPPLMVGIGLAGAAIAIIGGLVSSTSQDSTGALDQPLIGTRRFLSATGSLAACLFCLAILFQTAASLIIPQCHA